MSTTSVSLEAPVLDLHGAFVRRTDMSGASLRHANLAGADARGANFSGADFYGANLNRTILSGANLSGAKNLTIEQLNNAIIDRSTTLPDYIDRARIKVRSVEKKQ